MKKIYTTIIAMVALASVVTAQSTITFRIDMTNAMLGEDPACSNQVPFDPATDAVQIMGGDVNNWSAPETVNCGDPYTPDATVDFAPMAAGSMIYEKTLVLSSIGSDSQFKYRINHSWGNDELRQNNPDGNRHLMGLTLGMNYIVESVFDDSSNIVTVVSGINDINTTYNIKMAPNPVSTSAKFIFSTTKNYNVSLKIYDVLGKEVKTVVAEKLNAGSYEYVWNAENNEGAQLNNGCYFYSLSLDGTKVKTDKIYIVK